MNDMRKKIAGILMEADIMHHSLDTADKILSLETKTHRIAVIKQGEPPLLGADEMVNLAGIFPEGFTGRVGMMIARAQRKLCDEYYKGEK